MAVPGNVIEQHGARRLPRLHRSKNRVENLLLAESHDERQSFALCEQRTAAPGRAATRDSYARDEVLYNASARTTAGAHWSGSESDAGNRRVT
jgi:hypothetical protein